MLTQTQRGLGWFGFFERRAVQKCWMPRCIFWCQFAHTVVLRGKHGPFLQMVFVASECGIFGQGNRFRVPFAQWIDLGPEANVYWWHLHLLCGSSMGLGISWDILEWAAIVSPHLMLRCLSLRWFNASTVQRGCYEICRQENPRAEPSWVPIRRVYWKTIPHFWNIAGRCSSCSNRQVGQGWSHQAFLFVFVWSYIHNTCIYIYTICVYIYVYIYAYIYIHIFRLEYTAHLEAHGILAAPRCPPPASSSVWMWQRWHRRCVGSFL